MDPKLRGWAFTPLAAIAASLSASAEDTAWDRDWIVLTVSSTGIWGAASSASRTKAIADATEACRAKSGAGGDCGALYTTIRDGWSVAYQCGREAFVVAEDTLAAAKQAAIYGEIGLRNIQMLDLPPCEPLVTVDPRGGIVEPPSAARAVKAP